MRVKILATMAAAAVLATGCGSASPSPGTARGPSHVPSHRMSDGSTMSDADMKDMGHDTSGAQPSKSASMICGAEIRDAVKRTFGLRTSPSSSKDWSNRLFSCDYQVPGGQLRLSVKDLSSAQPGRAYFTGLRSRLGPVTTIVGVQSFGFPAFETADGNVVFIKDHKTLRVDASGLPARALPDGYTRAETAYSVASAVIGCWSE